MTSNCGFRLACNTPHLNPHKVEQINRPKTHNGGISSIASLSQRKQTSN